MNASGAWGDGIVMLHKTCVLVLADVALVAVGVVLALIDNVLVVLDVVLVLTNAALVLVDDDERVVEELTSF
jgi:hypothetical protein